jgi:hypothetical protein
MVRTQIQLTKNQSKALKAAAASSGVSMAELIRQAVDALLAKDTRASEEDSRARALGASGRFHSGLTDASMNHDSLLSEDFGS